MQSPIQRRRQLETLRPRQTMNDVNVGSMSPADVPAQMTAEMAPSEEISPEARALHFARCCAARDLI